VLSLLDSEGKLSGGKAPLSDDQTLKAFRLIRLSRLIDRRIISLNRQGKLGTYPPVEGQEAAAIGSAMALDRARDWIVPSYREQPALLVHGLPLPNLLATYFGKVNSARIPDGVNLFPRQQSVGAHLPQAVGLAWGLALMQTGGVVLAYFGEGASSEGDFHEALNLAGVMSAPVVFLLQNNGWAISTPRNRQTAAKSFALRAPGYGFDGLEVDGNDLFAVYQATFESVEKARGGGGPTLIEAHTYRLSMHNTTDNPGAYQPSSELDVARQLEPLSRLQAYLIKRGALDDLKLIDLDASISAELEAAIEEVERMPRPVPADVFENVYAAMPNRLAAQRASLEASLGGLHSNDGRT
jgi:pyruvate dehydrogenase E1 component alpha subunit